MRRRKRAATEARREPSPRSGCATRKRHPFVIGIEDASRFLMLDVFHGGVYALIREPDETYTELGLVEFDPVVHRWIRISWDAELGVVAFETSPDRATWSAFHEADVVDFDFAAARLLFYGGAWNGPIQLDPVVAFDNAFMCSLD